MKFNLILNLSFLVGLKILETVGVKHFETISSEINNQTNWLLDLYKKSKFEVKKIQKVTRIFIFFFEDLFLSTKEIEILTHSENPLRNQLTIKEKSDLDLEDHFLGEEYKNELLKSLIENENDKVKFLNTKNNVAISNSQQKSSKMCYLM